VRRSGIVASAALVAAGLTSTTVLAGSGGGGNLDPSFSNDTAPGDSDFAVARLLGG
jgi:hypothetical protein